jgi:hypothetical protein
LVIDAVVDPNIPPLPPEPRQQVIDKLEKALGAEPDEQRLRAILEREGARSGRIERQASLYVPESSQRRAQGGPECHRLNSSTFFTPG